MNRKTLTLIGIGLMSLIACSDNPSNVLSNGHTDDAFQHSNDPGAAAPGAYFEAADPAQVRAVGSPEVSSRQHSCGKISVKALGDILTSRGLTGGGRAQGEITGRSLYMSDGNFEILQKANYDARVPEAPFASTSAMTRTFDIFMMASYDAVTPDWAAPACPGVKLLGIDGKFTLDALTCLMGKPARAEHLAIANDAIARNPTDGAKIAVAALLSAAHTCQ